MERLVWWTVGCLWGHEMPPDPVVGSLALVGLLGLTRGSAQGWRAGLFAVVLGALWGGWWSPPKAPVASPEGVVQVSGEVSRATSGQHGGCLLVFDEPLLDRVAVPGRLSLKVAREACVPTPVGQQMHVMADVRGESWDANPGSRPPWAEPGWSWIGQTRETPAFTTGARGVSAWLHARAELPGEEVTGLYRALLLGDRRGISPWIRDAFGDTGTAHLLAISGLHLAVVGWGIYRTILLLLVWLTPLAHRMRAPALAAGLAVVMIWGYVGLVAPSQATLRAAVVLTSVMLASCLGRSTSPGHTLMVAAAAVLSIDPSVAKGPSFQLSFAAATSLVLLAPWLGRCREWLTDPDRPEAPLTLRTGLWLVQAALVSLTTACATAPLCLAWFGQFAPVGVLVNLVAVPLVSLLVVPSGMLWLIAQSVSPLLGGLLAPVPTWTGGLLLDLVEGWAQVVGPATSPMWPHAVAMAATCLVLGVLRSPHRWRWIMGPATAVGLFVCLSPLSSPSLSIELLDVGHGDAALVQLPEGANILVDAGGSRRGGSGDAWIARRKVLPALQRRGVDRLDLLVITHGDRDHLGGAIHLARRLPVSQVWLPLCDRDHPGVRELATAVRTAGGIVAFPHSSEAWTWSGASLRVLWPDPGDEEVCRRGRNNGSVVLSLTYAGRRLLLTGDMEAPVEATLIERRGDALTSDILKVAHHGSRTSSTREFLSAVRPVVSLISGPMRPGGGHPHPEVNDRLLSIGSRVQITGRDGALRVTIKQDGELQISAQR